MKVWIGAHWKHHIRGWLANLGVYLQEIHKFDLDYTKGFCNNSKQISAGVNDADLVILWNGEEGCYKEAKRICEEKGIPYYIAEVGYFPQRHFFTLDPKGINASSSLMEDDLSWISEAHMKKLRQTRLEYMGDRKRVEGDYVFVPLQVPGDTNIKLHSQFKDMQSFINHVEEKFANEHVIFKMHPRDNHKYKSKFEIVNEGSSLDYVLGAKSVYGINSTVLLESALFGVPVEAVGEGFLKHHKGNHDKLMAALVDRQIPYNSTDLDYWLKPILDRAYKYRESRDCSDTKASSLSKLEIGGGGKKRKGFLQVDIRDLPNVDFNTECWKVPLPDNSVSLVYGRHVFEHLTQEEADLSLKEWTRLLAPGGQVHMILPDLEFHAKQLLQPGNSLFLKTKTNFEHAMAAFYGWKGDAMRHQWGYTKNTIRELFLSSGFGIVEFKDTRACDIEILATVGNDPCDVGKLGGHAGITHIDEGSLTFLKNQLGVKTILDIGCGPGGQIKAARSLGIDSIGIDGDKEVLSISEVPERIKIHDFRSGPWIGDKVDAIWSIEFLEHVDEQFIENYMSTFKLGSWVVCTASQNAGVPYHVNCKPLEYWIESFKRYGFKYEEDLTNQLKKLSTMKRKFIQETGMVFSNEKR